MTLSVVRNARPLKVEMFAIIKITQCCHRMSQAKAQPNVVESDLLREHSL